MLLTFFFILLVNKTNVLLKYKFFQLNIKYLQFHLFIKNKYGVLRAQITMN
jgi:hypothetical protein